MDIIKEYADKIIRASECMPSQAIEAAPVIEKRLQKFLNKDFGYAKWTSLTDLIFNDLDIIYGNSCRAEVRKLIAEFVNNMLINKSNLTTNL